MMIDEQYRRLLTKQNEKELLALFQSLSAKERKALAPTVKRLGKEYLTFEMNGTKWSCKATDKQRILLNYSFFTCYDYKEIKRDNPAWLISREHLEKFLPWYRPSWLSDYINSFSESEWLPHTFDYGYLMDLTTRGFIRPTPGLIAKTLVPYIHENKDRQQFFRPDRLEEFAITLREHIWHLFEYETTVHYSNRYLYSEGQRVEKGWMDAFNILLEKGKIDKQRLLKEALLASHRNFNKTLSGWFAELFLQSQPSKEEILFLQPEIVNLFSSPYSKVVNTALQACKSILDCSKFELFGFLDHASLLLASSTKSVVTTTLQLLEKVAKNHKDHTAQICLLATGALIHKDEGLQSRAAKLIEKYGDTEDKDLWEALSHYKNSLFANAKALLQPYFSLEKDIEGSSPEIDKQETIQLKGRLTDATALPTITNIDELVFLSAQAFDNNESWHIDLLPAALIRLQNEIKGEHLPSLEPAIQRALKLYFGEWRSTQGDLDSLLACFFLDYCLWLIEQFPQKGETARELYSTFLSKNEENKKVWQEHGTSTSFFAGWKAEGRRYLYSAYRKLLEAILYNLKNRILLPVLSEPTHVPSWIDPLVLVERLAEHQKQPGKIDDTDLQIALSRCWLHGAEDAIRLAEEKLQDEAKRIMLFLLDPTQEPTGPFKTETAWMIAAMNKFPQAKYSALSGMPYITLPLARYTGQYPYEILIENYTYDDHKWDNGKHSIVKKAAQRPVIKIDFSLPKTPQKEQVSGLKKFFKRIIRKDEDKDNKEPSLVPLLYDYVRFNEQWLSLEDRDIRRLYLLTPNNPEPFLVRIIDKCLSNPAFSGEATKQRIVVQTLQALHDTWKPIGEMAHLFIATCMLSSDKTTASYAAEIWIKAIEEQSINNRLLGSILGRQERIEFAPTKRLTDLIVKNLFNISPVHDRALQEMLTMLLKELPETPVKGLRKLLEIYFELVQACTSLETNDILKYKMQQWKENNSLNKVIKNISYP